MISTLPTLTDRDLTGVPTRLGPWQLVGRTEVPGPASDQGIATVLRPDGRMEIRYTGTLSITSGLRSQEWIHVGDPDGWNGWYIEPFQGGVAGHSKMFRVTAPDGAAAQWIHTLSSAESMNNSFVAVSPDGQWMVSGEWGTQTRLLVFPTPGLNRQSGGGGELRVAGTLELRQAVGNVQGCAFWSDTRMLCSGQGGLLELQLDHPLSGSGSDRADVRLLGPIPRVSGCTGIYEPEGVDVDRTRGDLRIEVAPPPPCTIVTQVYEYRLASAG